MAPGNPALTKAELVEALHGTVGVTRQMATGLLESLLETVKDALEDPEDGEVKVAGFGTFRVHQKYARVGRNPRTREEALIRPRKVLVFRPSTRLRLAINGSEKP